MSEEKKGIENLKELATFVCEMGNGSGKALEDGKLTIADAVHFAKAGVSAPAAFIGIGQVDNEYFDLDEAEKAELNAHIAQKLDLPQDNIETITESILKGIIELSGAMKQILQAKKA